MKMRYLGGLVNWNDPYDRVFRVSRAIVMIISAVVAMGALAVMLLS